MKLSELTAISPVDGRYRKKVSHIARIVSEFGLIKYRVYVEIKWLQKLLDTIKGLDFLDDNLKNFLEKIVINFDEKDAEYIKNIERVTNHDVKAVEYFLKEKISYKKKLNKIIEFIHFACTSEDINNISYALMLSDIKKKLVLPIWKKIVKKLQIMAFNYKSIPMLSRTHGQPATPTTLGKEIANFSYRFSIQYFKMKNIKVFGKINGSVGNYNAHVVAYPNINWFKLSKEFITSLGINWNPYTTQIESHDYIAEILNCIERFNTIAIDFNRDIWGYISLKYFKQKFSKKEIGSSSMPHKINPIDFENSEGNLGLSNAVLHHLSTKLPISRWQRDLSDSTVLRNLGLGISYSIIAYKMIIQGVSKLDADKKVIFKELNQHWEVLSEPIQTVMRKFNIKKSYERLKILSRGKKFSRKRIKTFIDSLSIPEKEKIRLRSLTPKNYIGLSTFLTDKSVNFFRKREN